MPFSFSLKIQMMNFDTVAYHLQTSQSQSTGQMRSKNLWLQCQAVGWMALLRGHP